ncbi:ATP-binding protein [Streptomyces sp. NPDC051561]|uniref:ATP-binding protein n=1 Tax=Streptomyces sp. NPDC051561 TaxID=3365658 RepID=UPI0037B47D8E
MKQSAAKTLGVAALGAAFAATAAGSAAAAVGPSVPDAAGALTAVTSALPVDQATSKLPAGAPEALNAGKDALGRSAATAPTTAAQSLPAGEGADPVSGLLGGLPTKGLPTQGLPTQGLPTGAVPGLGVVPYACGPLRRAVTVPYQAVFAVFSPGRNTHRPR